MTLAESDLAEALVQVLTRVDMVARAQAEVLAALEAQSRDLARIIRYLEFLERQAQ